MSIASEVAVKRLNQVVADLEKRLLAVEQAQKVIIEGDDVPRETSPDFEELSLRYEQKFGTPPHHRMKAETIQRALQE